MAGKKLSDRDKGFILGVAWAVHEAYGIDRNVAEMVLGASGMPMSDFHKAGVTEYDRAILRKISPTRRDYYACKPVARKDGRK